MKKQPVNRFKLFLALLGAGTAAIALQEAILTTGFLQVVCLIDTVVLIVLSAANLIRAMYEVRDE